MFYGHRPSKSEKFKKYPFTYHHIHSVPLNSYFFHLRPYEDSSWQPSIRFASIDPGGLRKDTRSFALRIENRNFTTGNVKMEVFDLVKFTHPTDQDLKKKATSELYQRVNVFLNKYKDHFLKTHIIIIEQQLHVNYQSIRMMQHVISYFSFLLSDSKLLPMIIEVDSKLKTKTLNSPPHLNDTGIKKWAIDIAIQLLTLQDDQASVDIINSYKKKDDLADTVMQIEAFCVWMGWPSTYVKHAELFQLPTTSNFKSGINLQEYMKSTKKVDTPNRQVKIKIVK